MPTIAETAKSPLTWIDKALGWMQSPQRTQQMQGIGQAIQSGLTGMQDADRRYQYLQSKAFADPKRPARVTDQNALQELTNMTMSGPLGFAPAGLTVWHGSPHKFDKFDSSKIGTGEGAQAYGHGLYLAEAPEVAESYKTVLAGRDGSPVGHAAHVVSAYGGDAQKAMNHLKSIQPSPGEKTFSGESYELIRDAIGAIQSGAYKTADRGALYKVDLPDEQIAKMLDWDKPLSQQHPDVQAALANTKNKQLRAVIDYATSPYSTPGLEGEVKTMGEAIKLLGMNASPAKGSAMLAKQGIPGIRYLDQSSRGTGAGTSNFVVFPGNENMLQILERNGNPVNQAISEFNNNLQSFLTSRIK